MNIMLKQLLEAKVFSYVKNRHYHCADLYGKFSHNIMYTIKRKLSFDEMDQGAY